MIRGNVEHDTRYSGNHDVNRCCVIDTEISVYVYFQAVYVYYS